MLDIEIKKTILKLIFIFFTVQTNNKFSVFKTELKEYDSSGRKFASFDFLSDSLSESFWSLIWWKETPEFRNSFPGESCKFGVEKETEGRIVTYHVSKGDNCYSKPEEDLVITTGFSYIFVDEQDKIYTPFFFMLNSSDSFDLDIIEYTNETDSHLSIDVGTLKMKGLTLQEVGYSMTMYNNDTVFKYSWKMYPE